MVANLRKLIGSLHSPPMVAKVANLFCYSSLDALRFATYGGEGGEQAKAKVANINIG